MNGFEKKHDNEMDAAEMLEEFGKSDAAQEAERIVAEAAQEPCEEGETEGHADTDLSVVFRELKEDARKSLRREGWDALGLGAAYLCLAVVCAAALVTQDWELTMLGMAAVSLIGAGGYAVTGWQKLRA